MITLLKLNDICITSIVAYIGLGISVSSIYCNRNTNCILVGPVKLARR